ncbi:uncharacterized protein [Fopius arisanus]|uniref:chitin synthase n=1 Tax=Fopius arisanus TaxID=64838 RepID=A0A0C9RP55_9HYME|nr:PREDICTED: uncharacterized protein LOC105271092 [Fopius arisanus]
MATIYGRKPSYLEPVDEVDENSSDNEEETKKTVESEEEIYDWDLFRHYPPISKTGSNADMSFYEAALKTLKALTYLILFTLVLAGGVFAKASILLAAAQVERKTPLNYCDYQRAKGSLSDKQTVTLCDNGRIYWYWCVVLAFFLPEVITLLRASHHLLFKRKKLPFFFDAVFVCTVETFHAVAISLLFLVVLPEMNSLLAAAVTSCTCIIPAVLGLLSRTRVPGSTGRSFALMMIGDVIAVIAQASGIFLLPVSRSTGETARWILPGVLIFASCRWWSNFVSPKSGLGVIKILSRMKDRLEQSRGVVQGMTALCRISAFLGTCVAVIYVKGIDVEKFFHTFPGTGRYLINISRRSNSIVSGVPSEEAEYVYVSSFVPLVVLFIHVVASFMAYFAGKCASQVLMQKFGLATPVSLTVPSTIVFIFVLSVFREDDVCSLHDILPDYIFFSVPSIDSTPEMFYQWEQWLWIPWLLSQAWVTMHIWTPHCERLATTNRLFTVSYDSLMIDQSLMLSRRRDEPQEPQDTKEHPTTKLYVCATMWHEQEDEMMNFINSVIKLDLYRSSNKFTQTRYKVQMDDYYELESHVFFDDAFQCMHGCDPTKPCAHNENETQINSYVKIFIKAMEKSVTNIGYLALPPMKYPTNYGGRLEWKLPGKTTLTVHLKDKNKIRHRKRWSQVMYMYYLLGYCLMDRPTYTVQEKVAMSENTFLLTLDGDIDFDPSAVIVLLHLMERDKELGAACGRIHPMGSGPMVWYQRFEYAIGHWLQKSTEHVIGSVLCSPGAFSLFRAKTLMEDNVMRKYATTSSEARHYVQYDQGEDRWLCTLILQAGGKVEYCAASDSYTHAPETFDEFFKQRRRWIPSTIANILDLLSTSKETRRVNNNISLLYIIYEWILMGSTVLGPGTIFLMLVGAFVAAFRIDNWSSFAYNLIPIVIFVVVCFFCKEQAQLFVAAVISAIYGLMMVVVLVGIMIQITEDGWVAPTTILFFVVASQLVVAGLLHPQEVFCLVCGIIYYITVPSMYMLLIIYSLFNLNNVTWGTRESKPLVKEQNVGESDEKKPQKDSEEEAKDKGAIDFSFAGLFRCILCTHNEESPLEKKLDAITASLTGIGQRLDMLEGGALCLSDTAHDDKMEDEQKMVDYEKVDEPEVIMVGHSHPEEEVVADNSGALLVAPYWIRDKELSKGGVEFLSRKEEMFWERLIKKYLFPIDEDEEQQAKTAATLKSLRDEYLFKFFMINGLFVLIVFLMQLKKDILHLEWPLGKTYNVSFNSASETVDLHKNYLELEPIGCLFILAFVGILGIQFMAMLVHRFNTFCHVLANTSLNWKQCCRDDESDELPLKSQAHEFAKGLQRLAMNNAQPVTPATDPQPTQPRKRNTVHALISKENKTRLATDFETVFRQNMREPSANPKLTSMGISQTVLKAFERRRTTVVQRKSQFKRANSISQEAQGATGENHYNAIPSSHSHTYDNPAFIDDEEATLNRRNP